MGKGWAKGLSARTDPRVARMAEAHRGMRYVRRQPVEQCRWPFAGRTTLPLEWSDGMAYVVGLTATDGCLITGRRQMNFKSADRDLVALYLQTLGRTNRIGEESTRNGGLAYKTQFADASLYEWFRSVGLMPRKSLVLGALSVPDAWLAHLVRGLLDGDGSILNFSYEGSGKAHGVYEDLRTSSARPAGRTLTGYATACAPRWASGARSARIDQATESTTCIDSPTRNANLIAYWPGCTARLTCPASSESARYGIVIEIESLLT